MAGNQFSPEQIEKLVTYASNRLGTTPEQLKALFQREGLAGLSHLADATSMTADETAKAQDMIQNKEQAAKLMNDPRVQDLLRRLLGE